MNMINYGKSKFNCFRFYLFKTTLNKNRFDNENMGVVHSESLLKRLGLNEFLPAPSPRVDYKPEVPLPNIPSSWSYFNELQNFHF